MSDSVGLSPVVYHPKKSRSLKTCLTGRKTGKKLFVQHGKISSLFKGQSSALAVLTNTALNYFCKNHGNRSFFYQSETIVNVLVGSFRFIWIHVPIDLMGLQPLQIFNQFFQCGDSLYTSETDVYRPLILTYKEGPRTERVKPFYLFHKKD